MKRMFPWTHVSRRTSLPCRLRLSSRFAHSLRRVPQLKDGSLATFRDEAFDTATPHLLPTGHFKTLPGLTKWFAGSRVNGSSEINGDYLSQYGDVNLPMELTLGAKFTRISQPLSFFIAASTSPKSEESSVYIAQAPLADLPGGLQTDVPTPDLVLKAGKGDIYDSSIWLGRAPTYTPLHRDPNPNLFVQLAGTKKVRILNPQVGGAVFAHVQQILGQRGSAALRGEEMMQGAEKAALDDAIWGEQDESRPWLEHAAECEVSAGDGLFIPKGWWHSIKGVGEGMTGSVNWWFR